METAVRVEARSSRTSESESEKSDRPQSRDGHKYPQVGTEPSTLIREVKMVFEILLFQRCLAAKTGT